MALRKGETFNEYVLRMAAEEVVRDATVSAITVGSDRYLARLRIIHKDPRDEVWQGTN